MANLIIQENGVVRTRSAVHGEEITIQTPCDCTAVTGVKIANDIFPFYDACGKQLSGVGDLFSANSLIRVMIDTVNQRAIIINRGVTPANIGAIAAKESSINPGCYYREVGSIKEWFNPPMTLGQEYRTTERYKGKPVYVMAFSVGEAPKGDNANMSNYVNKGSEHGIKNCKMLHCYGTCDEGITLPYTTSAGGKVEIYAHSTSINLRSNYANAMTGVVAILKYWKTTD